MKIKAHIISDILAMYLLFLPVILIFHTQTHLQDTVVLDHTNPVNFVFEDHSDCWICGFCFNQQFYIQSIFVLPSVSAYYHSYQNTLAIPTVTTQEQYYLRGPPLI